MLCRDSVQVIWEDTPWHREGKDLRICRVTSQAAEPGLAQVALRQQPVQLGCWGRGAEKSQSTGTGWVKRQLMRAVPAREGKSSGNALSIPTKC